jgi:hypothetical protein
MTGSIALAGFMMTVDEWQELDEDSRAQLFAISLPREQLSIVASMAGAMIAPEQHADAQR